MSQAPFVIQPRLTALTLTYRNRRLIADDVLPRVQVDSQQFKYSKYTLSDGFTVPDTKVGRKSAPNQIDWTATETPDQTQDYALDDAVPNFDRDAANAVQAVQGVKPIDPEERSTILLSDLVALGRELRAAALVFSNATYPAANRTTLAGATQWSDPTSDPLNAILTNLDTCVIRPNVAVLGQATWTKLRMHSKITAAVYPNGGNATGGPTAVARQAVAELLELDEIIVGQGWVNTAKPGQPPNLQRVWGKHASFIYRNPNTMTTDDVTFGFTAQWGTRIGGTVANDPRIGMRGGSLVRVGEAVKELVAANDAAFFFENAVA